MLQVLGSFAEFSSDMLSEHVKKGLKERAVQGLITDSLPFGYRSCWTKEHGERKRICDPEHSGGIHQVPEEAEVVKEIYRRYSAGDVSTGALASWLNEQGFRTRNTKKLCDGAGNLYEGPRLFTAHAVGDLLKNKFFVGYVKYKGTNYQGLHDAIASTDLFDNVQDVLRKNNGHSRTFSYSSPRQYLLQGIVRCAYCLMPMWAQTYNNGRRYYREHRASRTHGLCPAAGGSISCDIADDQVSKLVGAIELEPLWMEEVMAILSVEDQVEDTASRRKRVGGKLQRLGKAYVDGVYQEGDYLREKRRLELELESLVVPEVNAAEDAGKLLQDLPRLWEQSSMTERRSLLLAMLEAVYVDHKENNAVVAIQPQPAFRAVFQVVTTRPDSGVILIKEPPDPSQRALHPCSWWRRGRVELYHKHGLGVLIMTAAVKRRKLFAGHC